MQSNALQRSGDVRKAGQQLMMPMDHAPMFRVGSSSRSSAAMPSSRACKTQSSAKKLC